MKHFQPRRVLVGTDLSPASGAAIALAAQWARHYRAALTVALAAHTDAPWEFTKAQVAELEAEHHAEWQRRLRQLRGFAAPLVGAGTELQCELLEGDPDRALAEAARKTGAELLVFAIHRQSHTAGIGLRSLPFELMRTTQLPLLALSEAATTRPRAWEGTLQQVLTLLPPQGAPGPALELAAAIAADWTAPMSVVASCASGSQNARAAARSAAVEGQWESAVRRALGDGHGSTTFLPNCRPGQLAEFAERPGLLLVLDAAPGGSTHWWHPEPDWEKMLRQLPAPALVVP